MIDCISRGRCPRVRRPPRPGWRGTRARRPGDLARRGGGAGRAPAARRVPCVRRKNVTAIASSTGSGCSPKTAASSKCGSTRQPAARTESCACWCWKTSRHCARRWRSSFAPRDSPSTRLPTGSRANSRASSIRIDVAVVDLGLPRRSGLDAIRAWRKAGRKFLVLILTARDSWQEKVSGLDAGADDYVTKPFRFEEVLARVQALLRRSGGWSQPIISCGAVALDTRAQEVRVAGEPVELTAFEYRLLEYLMLRARAGRVQDGADREALRAGFRAGQQYDRSLHRSAAPQARPRQPPPADRDAAGPRLPDLARPSVTPATPSLQSRLLLTLAALLLVAAAAAAFALDSLYRNLGLRALEDVLDAQVIALISTAEIGADGRARASKPRGAAPCDTRFGAVCGDQRRKGRLAIAVGRGQRPQPRCRAEARRAALRAGASPGRNPRARALARHPLGTRGGSGCGFRHPRSAEPRALVPAAAARADRHRHRPPAAWAPAARRALHCAARSHSGRWRRLETEIVDIEAGRRESLGTRLAARIGRRHGQPQRAARRRAQAAGALPH